MLLLPPPLLRFYLVSAVDPCPIPYRSPQLGWGQIPSLEPPCCWSPARGPAWWEMAACLRNCREKPAPCLPTPCHWLPASWVSSDTATRLSSSCSIPAAMVTAVVKKNLFSVVLRVIRLYLRVDKSILLHHYRGPHELSAFTSLCLKLSASTITAGRASYPPLPPLHWKMSAFISFHLLVWAIYFLRNLPS